jgi:hypothetical protein
VGPISLIADPRQFEPWLTTLGKLDSTEGAQAALGPEMDRFVMDGLAALRAPGAPADGPDESDLGRLRRLSEAGRRKPRALLATAATRELPAEGRLAIVALLLIAIEAGIWGSPLGEAGWIRVLAPALARLDQDDLPERLAIPAAAWAALATYLMHDSRPRTGRPAEFGLIRGAATAVSHLFPEADAGLIARYAGPLTNQTGSPVDPDAVLHVIELIVQEDPLAEAVDALEAAHPDWTVHKHSDALMHVTVAAGATFPKAAEALDAIPASAGTVAVLATGTSPAWTIAIRSEGTFIHVERSAQGAFTWRQYRLGSLTTPTRIGRDPEVATRARISNGPLSRPFPAALAALTATGFDLSADPPSHCPDEPLIAPRALRGRELSGMLEE